MNDLPFSAYRRVSCHHSPDEAVHAVVKVLQSRNVHAHHAASTNEVPPVIVLVDYPDIVYFLDNDGWQGLAHKPTPEDPNGAEIILCPITGLPITAPAKDIAVSICWHLETQRRIT